ncbi:enoyl-CoA hydratase-related protein, partial [Pseudomonas sp. SIMBA_065]
MRVLIAEHDHARYAALLREAAPDVEVLTSGDSAELARLAPQCKVWLGQPDLLASLLRQGLKPQWMQSTWAGITPLLADGLPRDYRLTRAVGKAKAMELCLTGRLMGAEEAERAGLVARIV